MLTSFTPAQVKALNGGTLPSVGGFDWSSVESFRLEDGLLQPYAGDEILPGPALKVTITAESTL